jgi:hypothetical protein
MDESSPAVNESVVADTTSTESAPVETTSSEVAEDEFDGLGDIDLSNPSESEAKEDPAPKAEPDTEDAEEPVESEVDEQPQGKAEERKQQLNNEIRDLVSQRNAIRAEVEKINAEAYQPATDEELLGQINPETGEYYNTLEAKIARMEQTQEIARYNNEVAEAQLTLSSEASRALNDFPMFDSESKEYNPEIAAQADALLGQNLVFDPNTRQIIGSHTKPYQLYKTIADAYKIAATKGQASAQKATERMLANADRSSDVPTRGSADPMADLEARIANVRFSS